MIVYIYIYIYMCVISLGTPALPTKLQKPLPNTWRSLENLDNCCQRFWNPLPLKGIKPHLNMMCSTDLNRILLRAWH